MPQKIRVRKITSEGRLVKMNNNEKIESEEKLEGWLESDISIIDPDLFVVGRQVETGLNGIVDLLCLDCKGDIVVIELKKDRTPRDVTAQTLDYASWAKNLDDSEIRRIWKDHYGEEISLDKAFSDTFHRPLPDALNASQRSLIVANFIDASTERIVHYLSGFGVPINVATVQYFKDYEGGCEILAQAFMAQERDRLKPRKSTKVIAREMQEAANQKGVGGVYEKLCSGLTGIMSHGKYDDMARYFRLGGKMTFVAEIGKSDIENGLKVRVNVIRLANQFGADKIVSWKFCRNAKSQWIQAIG